MERFTIFRLSCNFSLSAMLKRFNHHSLTLQTSKASNSSPIIPNFDSTFFLRDTMKDQINQVFRQAQKTFSCDDRTFEKKLRKLIHLMSKTTASDLNLNPEFMSKDFWRRPNKAPVTYVELYEDDLLTMGVFVLKDGMKLPLHDHPEMYGLIKVLMGRVRVKSFSAEEDPELLYTGTSPITLTAEMQPDVFADSKSDVCILRPRSKNIHEIESVDGPAAFFDILSPPYDTPMSTMSTRKCNYFEISGKVNARSYKLMEIEPPKWFWNDRNKYAGPAIKVDVHEDGFFRRVVSYFKNMRLWRVFSTRDRVTE